MILVVSGPGGVGKGTVLSRVLESDPLLWLNRSWTTRARRPGEPSDAYVFATRSEFERQIEAGGFLEWVEFLDYLQGSPVPQPPPGHDVVFEIDVYGAARVRELYPDAVLVFIDAPSRDVQEQRLRARGDTEERVMQRLAKADEEVAKARELGAEVLINDDLDAAVEELSSLVRRARAARR